MGVKTGSSEGYFGDASRSIARRRRTETIEMVSRDLLESSSDVVWETDEAAGSASVWEVIRFSFSRFRLLRLLVGTTEL